MRALYSLGFFFFSTLGPESWSLRRQSYSDYRRNTSPPAIPESHCTVTLRDIPLAYYVGTVLHLPVMFSLKLKGWGFSKPSFMKRQLVDSGKTSADSSASSNRSSVLSSETVVAPAPKCSKGGRPALSDYAEMLEDENMSWGPPKSRRR